MSKGQRLRALVNERLTAAAEDIFALFERTIAEYEEELCRSKEENERKQQLLDSVLSPRVLVHRAGPGEKTQEEEDGPSLKQENPDCPQIKDEQDPCIRWEQEHFQDFQDFPPDLDEGKPGLDFSLDPQRYLQRDNEQTDHSSDAGGEIPQDWEPPIDEDIEADGKDYNQQRDLDSVRTLENLDHETSPESSNAQVTKKLGRKPRYCSVCEKKFASSQDLRRHMSVHTGERPFSCPVCEKRFSRKGSLRYHMLVHTGDKPFRCPVCGRTFSQKGNLNAHVVLHTGEKPFGCTECDAKFPLRPQLLRHMKTHTGDRPFSCSFCERGFRRKEHLRRHVQTHTATE